jgi:hypothetical protein
MTNPLYELKADLNGDGTFETDWSTFLKGLKGVTLWRDSALDAFPARAGALLMDNEDRRFSPKNASSPYSPDLKRGVKVQLKATVTTPAASNLIENPSLENDAVGWADDLGVLTRVTTQAKYGAACGSSVGAAAGAQAISVQNRDASRIPVTASLSYVWRVWMLAIGGSSDWHPVILWHNSGGSVISSDSGTVVTLRQDGPWAELLVIAVAPGTAVTAFLGIIEDGSSFVVGETVFIDAAFFYQGTDTSQPYVDGDQPGATWSGTAHESTSSRAANPQTALLTGSIRNFRVSRSGEPLMEMQVTGHLETLAGIKISAGPFTRKPSKVVIQRLLDIMTPGELIDDGAFRVAGDNIILNSPFVIGGVTDTAKLGGPDPETYGALEGDAVFAFRAGVTVTDRLAGDLDMTSRTNDTDAYDIRQFLATNDTDMVGEKVLVEAFDNIGVVASVLITLTLDDWQYAVLKDVQFNSGSTSRSIRWTFDGSITATADGFLDFIIDGLSMYPSKNRIERSFNPPDASNFDEDIEYLDAFERSALATLEEAVKSAGGWWLEDGLGALVFEDFDQRSPTAVAKLRLTDTEIEDGFYVSDPQYSEPAANFYNRIRVASFGDVSLLTVERRTLWAFEPVPRAYGNDARVRLRAQYLAEEGEEGLILRRAVAVLALTAGAVTDDTRPLSGKSVPSPYVENYGRAGLAIARAGGAGMTVSKFKVRGRAQNRSTTERTFVDKVHAGTDDDQPRLLELEMPAQGYRTQLMTDLADWADRYGNGLSKVRLELKASDVPLLLEVIGRQPGLPVRYRQVTGPGASMADELYYLEGWQLDHEINGMARLTMLLEEAT